MSTDENVAIVQQLVDEVWNRGNLALLDEFYAPDASSQSREQFKEAVRVYRTAFPDLQVTIDLMVAAGDAVMLRWTMRGAHTGAIRGINASDVLASSHMDGEHPSWLNIVEPTKKRVTVTGASSYRLSEGRIVSLWVLFDQISLLAQIGALPEKVPGSNE